jgi:hypothetical protein
MQVQDAPHSAKMSHFGVGIDVVGRSGHVMELCQS